MQTKTHLTERNNRNLSQIPYPKIFTKPIHTHNAPVRVYIYSLCSTQALVLEEYYNANAGEKLRIVSPFIV